MIPRFYVARATLKRGWLKAPISFDGNPIGCLVFKCVNYEETFVGWFATGDSV